MPEREIRSIGFEREEWEWLVAEAERHDRTPAAELRHLLKWVITLRRQGFGPEDRDPASQLTRLAHEVHLLREQMEIYRLEARDGRHKRGPRLVGEPHACG